MPYRKIIQAKFKGRNGSLGLIIDKFYDISLEESTSLELARTGVLIKARIKEDLMSSFQVDCEYSSLKTFLDNWTCIMVKN